MRPRAPSTRLRYVGPLIVALIVHLNARELRGQSADTTARCDGSVVGSIDVETNRPRFGGAMAWWRKLARSIGLHHQTTNPGLVRRFVTLDPGERCTEFRRSESERILRAQPYIADAVVTTTRVGDSARVDVTTFDEVPVVGGARLTGARIRALSIGTLNFQGAGMRVQGKWEDGRTYRDGVGARISHSQLFGKPYTIELDAQRRPIGEDYTASLRHAFLTDLQRVAWHTGVWSSKDIARLRRPDHVELVQPIDRWMWNVGGVLRFGPPRRAALVGGVVIGERVETHTDFSQVDSLTGRLLPATDTTGVRLYAPYNATNVAGIVGLRALTFTRMRGLDALVAEQDVGTGTQVATIFGLRPFAGDPLENSFAAVDAYFAGRSRRNFVGARFDVESRLNVARFDWEHLIASGRAAWYFKPTPRWVSELSLEGAGGWRTILPFQVELGDRQTGLRGYERSRQAGGQRLLARFEQRVDLARYQVTRAALGAVVFTDVGKVWAGDVPFGVDAPIAASIGAGVLAAVPARSQRMLRAELAMPLNRSRGARPELRFTVREPARGFWFEPRRLHWARLSAVPEQIFSWP